MSEMAAKHIKKMLDMVGSGKEVLCIGSDDIIPMLRDGGNNVASIGRFEDKISFDNAAFDMVCIPWLKGSHDADSLLIECYRVLNDGGTLVFSTPKKSISNWKNLLYTHGFELTTLKSNSVLGDIVPLFGDTLIIKAVKRRYKVVRDKVVLDQRPVPLTKKLNHVTKV